MSRLNRGRWDAEWETGSKRLLEEFDLTWEEAQTYQSARNRAELAARVQERFDFLSVQRQDLEEANESLQQLIAELDKTMSESFEEGFIVVNEAFKVVFKVLFNGGFAELRLVTLRISWKLGWRLLPNLLGKSLSYCPSSPGENVPLRPLACFLPCLG